MKSHSASAFVGMSSMITHPPALILRKAERQGCDIRVRRVKTVVNDKIYPIRDHIFQRLKCCRIRLIHEVCYDAIFVEEDRLIYVGAINMCVRRKISKRSKR